MTKEEARKRWTTYLKSSEPKKLKGQLQNPFIEEERCCLGHACYTLNTPAFTSKGVVHYGNRASNDFSCTSLPDYIAELLDITPFGKFVSPIAVDSGAHITSLSELNDTTEYFPHEIGEWLENNWDKLLPYQGDKACLYLEELGKAAYTNKSQCDLYVHEESK